MANVAPYGIAGRGPPPAPSNLNPRNGGGWTEYFTADGRPYYHNENTKTTQWTKPMEFDRVAPPPAAPMMGGTAEVAGPPGANVFVFHIPNEWTQNEVVQNFSTFGRVISCYIATDRTTGRNKGYGFVSFDTIEAAANAVMGMNGFLVGQKRLKVSIKTGEEAYVAHLMNAPSQQQPLQGAGPQGVPYGQQQQRGFPQQSGAGYPAQGAYGGQQQSYNAPGGYNSYSGAAASPSQYGPNGGSASQYGPSGNTGYSGGMAGGNYRSAPY